MSMPLPRRVYLTRTKLEWNNLGVRASADEIEYVHAAVAVPRNWDIAEDIDSLPVGAVVIDASERVWRRNAPSRYGWSDSGAKQGGYDAHYISQRGPGLVLLDPRVLDD